jgi:hypothetical protein
MDGIMNAIDVAEARARVAAGIVREICDSDECNQPVEATIWDTHTIWCPLYDREVNRMLDAAQRNE